MAVFGLQLRPLAAAAVHFEGLQVALCSEWTWTGPRGVRGGEPYSWQGEQLLGQLIVSWPNGRPGAESFGVDRAPEDRLLRVPLALVFLIEEGLVLRALPWRGSLRGGLQMFLEGLAALRQTISLGLGRIG